MIKPCILTLFLFLLCVPFTIADQLRMKNGDLLTGELQKADATSLILKISYAGEITVARDAIEAITISQPVYVTLQDGTTVSGTISQKEGNVEIQTAGALVVRPVAEVTVIRSEAVHQAEVVRFDNPGWTELWSGFVETGLSLTSGNSETLNFASGANASRSTKRDKTGFYLASIYAQDKASGVTRTTANTLRGGGRYEYNLSDRFTSFGFMDLEHDEFQNLDLRTVLGGGLGWYLRKDDRSQFQVFGGASYNRENFTDELIRNSGELLAGQQFSYVLTDRVSLKEQLVFFPNLSESGEFRANFDTALVTKLSKWFDWHITFSDRYISNPVPGTDSNDLLLTTGIRLTFNK